MKAEEFLKRYDRKLFAALVLGVVLSAGFAYIYNFNRSCDKVRGEVVRLHIPANSDSAVDQRVKILVRDAVIKGTEDIFKNADSREEALLLAKENIEYIENIAKRELLKNGFYYGARVKILNMYFPTKKYENRILPAGRYDAIRIELGSGKGKNWWCVMYPQLCIGTAVKEEKKEVADIDSLNEKPACKLSFAAVELWEKLKRSLSAS